MLTSCANRERLVLNSASAGLADQASGSAAHPDPSRRGRPRRTPSSVPEGGAKVTFAGGVMRTWSPSVQGSLQREIREFQTLPTGWGEGKVLGQGVVQARNQPREGRLEERLRMSPARARPLPAGAAPRCPGDPEQLHRGADASQHRLGVARRRAPSRDPSARLPAQSAPWASFPSWSLRVVNGGCAGSLGTPGCGR